MPINRDFWLKSFRKESIPSWKCPLCEKGSLQVVHDSFKSVDDGFSKKLYQPTESELESVKYRFVMILECNNDECQETVACAGRGDTGTEAIIFSKDNYDINFFEKFYPEYFFPPINIFPLHEKCPKAVVSQIQKSFKLFFADPSAAANYVRKAVDEILTSKNINRFTTNKNRKRVPINLHDRIVSFEKINSEMAQKLFAIKWLGNEGSHTDKITKNDVLDAYEILELIIDELYVGYKKMIEKKILKINKTRVCMQNRK